MRKIAIFVEGWTEQIFVRNVFLRIFDLNKISFSCRTLFNLSKYNSAPYDYENSAAEFHYEIINIGNDNKVLTSILRREKFMWDAGFERIIGLRDMYSRAYREESRVIDLEVNQRFVAGHGASLERAQHPERIHFCFAIMEAEAWFLAMPDLLLKFDQRLTPALIFDELGVNISELDPENEVFHPSQLLDRIYQLANRRYDKKQSTIESLTNLIDASDLRALLEAKNGASFNHFFNKIPQPEAWLFGK